RASTHEVLFAAGGEQALEQLRVHPDIDVVLTDITMPNMDGLTLLGRVSELYPTTKVVIISAYGDMSNIRRAMNLGAFDFLVKPIEPTDLLLTVEKTRKHVQEMRRTIRSIEENSLLRMFVHGGLIERMLPVLRAEGTLVNEAFEAAVAFI